jgi:hypothetical protein
MTVIERRAKVRRAAVRETLLIRYPHLLPRPSTPVQIDRSAIVLGRNDAGTPVFLPLRARLEHSHVIGTTGGGKTKFLEHAIRQDVIDGRGVCVVDPHGNHPDSLYRSVLSWLDLRGYTKSRTIHLIDPNAATHVTGLDPLALPSPDYDFTVIAEAMQEALERVWGEEDMNTKPTMQRVLNVLLTALTELGLTLAEARLLLDPDDRHGIRAWAIANLTDEEAREELEWLDEIAREPRGRQDFRAEVTGPRNRLAKLTRGASIRTMLGQQERTIDFRAALDEGHIILANLSPGPRASDAAVQLLGRLLTRMLFFHCARRRHPERPFFFYLDECQLYLSGDVSRLLAESRKYGCGVIASHQYLAQFEQADLDLLQAVKNATNVKVVFRIKDAEEAAELADTVLRYDLELPVKALTKPAVVGQRIAKLKGESVSEQLAHTAMRTDTKGSSLTKSYSYSETTAETVSEAVSSSEGQGWTSAQGASDANVSGSGSGFVVTDTSTPGNGLVATPNLVSTSQGHSAQISGSLASGSSSGQGVSSSSASSRTSGTATTTASTWSEGVAYTTSSAESVGTGETRGTARTEGTQEAFESIFEDRPTAVHGLENLRYMAAQVLRNLTAGRAAVSFVDATGMKTAALQVAHVESYALPPSEFEELRARVLDASPSATPLQTAVANLVVRKAALNEAAEKLRAADEGAPPAAFRTKKIRSPRDRTAGRRLHGERKPAERAPSQGSRSPEATAVGRP